MNASQSSRRPAAAVVVQCLLWLWLICLSVLVALGYQTMSDLADQERTQTFKVGAVHLCMKDDDLSNV